MADRWAGNWRNWVVRERRAEEEEELLVSVRLLAWPRESRSAIAIARFATVNAPVGSLGWRRILTHPLCPIISLALAVAAILAARSAGR